MSTLFSYGWQVLSRRKPVTAVTAAAAAGSALASVNDDVLGTVSLLDGVNGGWAFDVGASFAHHYMAVGGHNTNGATSIRFQGSNLSDFSVLTIDEAMTVVFPNFWVDLRATAPSARYVRYVVANNNTNLFAGEIAVGQFVTLPSFQWDYTVKTAYLEQLRGQTEMGGYVRRKHAIAVRSLEVRFASGDANMRTLWNIGRWAQTSGQPVIVVPDDSVNDVWFVDWPDPHSLSQMADNRGEFSLVLQEQSPGKP